MNLMANFRQSSESSILCHTCMSFIYIFYNLRINKQTNKQIKKLNKKTKNKQNKTKQNKTKQNKTKQKKQKTKKTEFFSRINLISFLLKSRTLVEQLLSQCYYYYYYFFFFFFFFFFSLFLLFLFLF